MSRRASLLLPLLLTLVACTAGDQPQGNGAAPAFGIEYEKYTLDNGLDVILHVDDSDPVVAVSSVYHVGSSREVPGRTGFAHFFEHMTFNDSENVPRGANRKYIPELGGSRNGGTSFDYTMYYEVVPKDALEKIFWIDSDRMGYMINTVTEAALEREKQVVKNEKRERYDNAPYGHSWNVLLSNLFPEGHPYSWGVIGSLEDLQNARLDDVKEFYDRWYGANNATLVVAGDFDPDVIKPQIEQWFGEIRRGPDVEQPKPRPVTLDESKDVWYPDNFAKLPQLTRVYPTVENFHPDMYALEVLTSYLSDSKRSPLYVEIVEKQKLAPSVGSYNSLLEMAGWLQFSVRGLAGTKLDDVTAAIDKALAQFAEEGIPANELLRIKAEQETGYYSQLTSVLGKANLLANLNEFAGDPAYATKYVERMQAVTAEDVMRVFEKYVKGQHYVQTSFVPKDTPELAVTNALLADVVEEKIVQGAEAEVSQGEEAEYEKTPSKHDRSEPPLGEAPVVRSPDIWTRTLANGIAAMGIEDDEVPLVAFNILLPGGRWLDDSEHKGAAALLGQLLNQGTANRTPAELEEAIGMLGSSIQFGASGEAFTISAVTLERNLEATLELVEEMILEPRWDEAEFERLRSAAEAQVIASRGNANAVSSQVWNRLAYGSEHPYGRQSGGSIESIQNMSMDDLKAWHADHFAPEGALLQVVGAANSERVANAFSGIAERWKGAPAKAPTYKLEPEGKSGVVYFIDMPGAKQSVLRVGRPAVMASDPDWPRLSFANQEIGGGASGRLMQLLRIEKGYTYGAYSMLGSMVNDVSPWVAGTSVRANVTLESMELLREQIANYAETFTDEDAAVTRNLVVKRNARAFETPNAKLGLLNRIAEHGLPHDVVEREAATLEGMSTADFREVISEYLDESKMIWVVVGDGATQGHRLTDFGYGEAVELDQLGEPVESVN